jgi:hypothetical protein
VRSLHVGSRADECHDSQLGHVRSRFTQRCAQEAIQSTLTKAKARKTNVQSGSFRCDAEISLAGLVWSCLVGVLLALTPHGGVICVHVLWSENGNTQAHSNTSRAETARQGREMM